MKMEDQMVVIPDLVLQQFQQHIIHQNQILAFPRIQGLMVSVQQIIHKVGHTRNDSALLFYVAFAAKIWKSAPVTFTISLSLCM